VTVTGSSTRSSRTPSGTSSFVRGPGGAPEPEDPEHLALKSAFGDDRASPSSGRPTVPDGRQRRRVLLGRDYDVRAGPGGEVLRQLVEQPGRDAASVRPPIEGEVCARIGVPRLGGSRQVRWVRHDAIEAAEPPEEVRADDLDRKTAVPRRRSEVPEGRGVEIGRDDPGSALRRPERREAAPRSHFRESLTARRDGEREQEEGILPRGVDLGIVRRRLPCHGASMCRAARHALIHAGPRTPGSIFSCLVGYLPPSRSA
jgi:hypothetical protein